MIKKDYSHTKPSDELNTNKTFIIGVYLVLCLVSTIMTIMNIFTKKGLLTCVTGTFAVLCLLNIILTLIGGNAGKVARVIFAVEVVSMFTYFLVSGNPDGFSAIWIALLPPASLYFFGRKKGTVICGCMLLILILLLWIPMGKSLLLYSYSNTFCMRFPVLFIAFFALAYFLEIRREKAYTEMHKLQEYYRELSARDSLTKLYNRQGMYACISEEFQTIESGFAHVAILDIDDFKLVNDSYGHDAGDMVLKKVAAILSETLKGVICRWGGEEFVAIIPEYRYNKNDLEEVRKKIEVFSFQHEQKKFYVTVSMGVCQGAVDIRSVDALVANADTALYEAKTTGKNRIVFFSK